MRVFVVIAVFAILLSWTVPSLAISPAQQMQGRTVTNVAPSPDGKRVVWIETRSIMTDDTSEYQGVLYGAAADGSNRRRLTFGAGVANVRWSPDGRWLAFLRKADNKQQLEIMRGDGGESRRLTKLKSGVIDHRWARDATQIAFVAVDEPSEEKEKRNKKLDDPIRVDREFQYQHLWRVTIPGDAEQDPEPVRVTEGEFHVSGGFVGGFDWSADGSQIAFSHAPNPLLDSWTQTDISVVDLATGKLNPVASTAAAEGSPIYSPDGSRIAFTVSSNPPVWTFETRVAVMRADGQGVAQLASTPDEFPTLHGWLDNANLLVSEAAGTTVGMYKLPTAGQPAKRLDDADSVVGSIRLNATGSSIGFQRMSSAVPPEAFVTAARRYRPVQVSAANEGRSLALGRTETVRWQSSDDLEVEGLLTYPVGYNRGERVPLLLMVHGGPAGVFTQYDIAYPRSIYPIAVFASAGYAVLRVNPRGSSGRGAEFRRANKNDWGGGDYRDLMTGVDHVIDLGVADSERLGVMGWSYGGFMTSWIITQTNRFKAASIGAPVTNLIDFNGTADIRGFIPDYFGGDFWDREAVYRAHSPLFHVANVRTPALIQHGQADARVPLGQGLALYRALERRGVETEMVIYPRAPHGPQEPRQIQHIAEGNLAWFEKHIPVNR